MKPRDAALEHAAQQKLPELALDELRQTHAIARLRGRAQEGLQMLADHLMEHGVLGVSRAIQGHRTLPCLGVARPRRPAHTQRSIPRFHARP